MTALAGCAALLALAAAPAEVRQIGPADGLQDAVDRGEPPLLLRLAPGVYEIEPAAYEDDSCGNCAEPAQRVAATRGLLVAGKEVVLVGNGPSNTEIRTHAGYGILAVDAKLRMVGVTITGGTRDPDARATDAAIVAKRSTVKLEGVRLAGNVGDPAIVRRTAVGIAGVVAREGSDLTLLDAEIVRNSWDGVALYRGAHARIEGCLIDGVDPCRGAGVCGGRGTGIQVAWDARGIVRGTLVTRYGKGIGASGDADLVAEEDVVEDTLAWGLALAGTGGAGTDHPRGVFRRSAVSQTGACGVLVSRHAPPPPDAGEIEDVAVTRSGQDGAFDPGTPYGPQTAIAFAPRPAGFTVARTVLFDNREPGACPGADDTLAPDLEAICNALARWRWPRASAFYVLNCAGR